MATNSNNQVQKWTTSAPAGVTDSIIFDDGTYVGIGVSFTSPESLLHVQKANSGGLTTVFIDNNASSAVNNAASLRFAVDSGASVTNGGAEIKAINVNAGNGAVDLVFTNYDGGSNAEHLRILANGNVGIGTTSPGEKLQLGNGGKLKLLDSVGSNAAVIGYDGSAHLIFNLNANGYTEFQLNGNNLGVTSGKVGIGTTDPGKPLHVHSASEDTHVYVSSAAPSVRLGNHATFSSRTNELVLGLAASAGNYLAGTVAGDGVLYVDALGAGTERSLIFGTTGTERMRITAGGYVGIGTADPKAPLHIINDATSSPAGTAAGLRIEVGSYISGAPISGDYCAIFTRITSDSTRRDPSKTGSPRLFAANFDVAVTSTSNDIGCAAAEFNIDNEGSDVTEPFTNGSKGIVSIASGNNAYPVSAYVCATGHRSSGGAHYGFWAAGATDAVFKCDKTTPAGVIHPKYVLDNDSGNGTNGQTFIRTTGTHVHLFASPTVAIDPSIIQIAGQNLGAGAPGPRVEVGRNGTNGGGTNPYAPGTLLLYDRNNNPHYIWVDTTGDVRVNSSPPLEGGSDTIGTKVGSQ